MQISQEMFDAVCSMPRLEGLWIKHTRIEDLRALPCLERLGYLYIGSSPRLDAIDTVARLPCLRWLGLERITRVRRLDALRSMVELEGLELCGTMGSA